jgi:hypothetical protein
MSSCCLYSDVSLRFGRRCYATVYVYESKEYWEVNECPLPEHCDVPAAEVAALTRGLLRAYQRVPQTVPINAYTDMDGAIELLRRRRFRGSFGGHVRQLSEVVDQRTNVLVLSVPRSNDLYKQCHNRARAAAKWIAAAGQQVIRGEFTSLPDLFRIVYDLGVVAASHPTAAARSEAETMLTLFQQKYAKHRV